MLSLPHTKLQHIEIYLLYTPTSDRLTILVGRLMMGGVERKTFLETILVTDYSTKSLQFIFNKIARHLLKQNAQARDYKRGCVCYDVITKRRCAAGCLLPLKYYKRHPDTHLSKLIDICKIKDMSEQYKLIKDLQIMHDGYMVEEWPDEIRRIAKQFNLKVPSFLKDVCNT